MTFTKGDKVRLNYATECVGTVLATYPDDFGFEGDAAVVEFSTWPPTTSVVDTESLEYCE